MPLSYQGRQAVPPSAPSDDVRSLIAENRRLHDASKENERLRKDISEISRQKEQLETALEECMDLLLQVGGKNNSNSNNNETEVNRAMELLTDKTKELEWNRQELESVKQQHADERILMHHTITQLSQRNEELSKVIKQQQSDIDLSRIRSEELLSLDAELHNRMEDLQLAVTQKEEDSVKARVQAANAASALVEERRRREEDAQLTRKLQSQLQTFRRNSQSSSDFSQLAADANRIRQDLNNRRSVSEKWSLSPDHVTPTPPRKSPLLSTPTQLAAPPLPSPAPRMQLPMNTSVEAV